MGCNMINDIEKLSLLHDDLGEEKFDEVMKRVEKAEKKQKLRNTLSNSMSDDYGKGCMRNQKCPVCSKKMKKCCCGFTENYK